jgi:hypothetical protein
MKTFIALAALLSALVAFACGSGGQEEHESSGPVLTDPGTAGDTATGAASDPPELEMCDPGDRAGLYVVTMELTVGDCTPGQQTVTAALDRPFLAPDSGAVDAFEVSPSGCSHRVRCWDEGSGLGHELAVTQVAPDGREVVGAYWIHTAGEAMRCEWALVAHVEAP